MLGRQGLWDARLPWLYMMRLLPHRQQPRGGSLTPLSCRMLETVKLGGFGVSYQVSYRLRKLTYYFPQVTLFPRFFLSQIIY